MMHIMKKIADWVLEKERKEPLDCSISDEIVQEWLQTVQANKAHVQKKHGLASEEYEMLLDVEKKLKEILRIRAQKC